jgi:hypothetical protein
MRAHRIANFPRVCALCLFDGSNHDARRGQCSRLFGQGAAERLHCRVVHILTTQLAQEPTHLGNLLLVPPPLLGALLQHLGPSRDTRWPSGRARRTGDRTLAARSQRGPPRWAGRLLD